MKFAFSWADHKQIRRNECFIHPALRLNYPGSTKNSRTRFNKNLTRMPGDSVRYLIDASSGRPQVGSLDPLKHEGV